MFLLIITFFICLISFLIYSNFKSPSFLYFLKRKLFFYLRKRKSRKKFFIFQETELSYISLIFQEVTFWIQKNIKRPTLKKLFVFQKTELSYISRVIQTNFLIFLVLKDKNSCFFPLENHVRFFIFHFFECFIIHLSRVFSFSSFVRCFCIVLPRVLQIWESLFLLSGVSYLLPVCLNHTVFCKRY